MLQIHRLKTTVQLVCAGLSLTLLAACTGSSDPVGGSSASGWTSYGTDVTPSAANSVRSQPSSAKWVDYNPPSQFPKMTRTDSQVAMSDGVKLTVSLVMPADAAGKVAPGPLPTILQVTGYNKDIGSLAPNLGIVPALGGPVPILSQHGYAQVIVDDRGTGRSQGSWDPFSPLAQSDYETVVSWITSQSWSNGSIGIWGVSYATIPGMLTAAKSNPAVKAAFLVAASGDPARDLVFPGGNLGVAFLLPWDLAVGALGLIDPLIFLDPNGGQTELDHLKTFLTGFNLPILEKVFSGDPRYIYEGPFWSDKSPINAIAKNGKVETPTFILGGLHCIFQRGQPLLYEALKGHASTKLLIGPWTHVQDAVTGGEPAIIQAAIAAAYGEGLPADGIPLPDHIALQWFDQYLKGLPSGAGDLPNVTQYVYGHDHFVTASDWPNPAAHAERMFLHQDHSLSATAPAGTQTPMTLTQNVLAGLCSQSADQGIAGAIRLIGTFVPSLKKCSTYDNTVQQGELVYDSGALTQDLYLNGPIEADIWMSSTAKRANVVVRVDDLDADGKAFGLTTSSNQASLRMVDPSKSRYLDGQMIEPWHPLTPESVQELNGEEIVKVPVELFPTAALIKAGHHLRISVGTGDFPRALPPELSKLPDYDGTMSVYSDALHPSSIVIPEVPTSALQ